LDLFYGSSLFIETIGVEFPGAHIKVIDNGSILVAALRLKDLANKIDAEFMPILERPHWELVQELFLSAQRPFAMVDPDVIFWGKMDIADAILSGRLIPTFMDPFSDCITHERLHTSLLKVADPPYLQTLIHSLAQTRFDWRPFQPLMLEVDGKWIRYYTAAVLYASIKSICKPIGKKELDAYDHLYCGSHLDQVLPKMGAFGNAFLGVHQEASRGNLSALKGIYQIQEQFFESNRLK
jgi:hypothetical protein